MSNGRRRAVISMASVVLGFTFIWLIGTAIAQQAPSMGVAQQPATPPSSPINQPPPGPSVTAVTPAVTPAVTQPVQATSQVGWLTPAVAVLLSTLAVLAFGISCLFLQFLLLKKKSEPEQILRNMTVTLVVTLGTCTITLGYEQSTIAPIIGLFGTIIGFLLGQKVAEVAGAPVGPGVVPPRPEAPAGVGVVPPGPEAPPGAGVVPPGPEAPPGAGVVPPGSEAPPGAGVVPPGSEAPPGEGVVPPGRGR
jgi:hypothetical protein